MEVRSSANMKGLQPKDQAGTWQLLSVSVTRETSAGVSMIVERLKPECAHSLLVIFSLRETRSWDVPKLKLPG